MAGTWTWTDAWMFIGAVLAMRAAFFWIATKAFILMIPDGDVCPMCDSATLAIERAGWWKLLGARFRRSWCIGCGWEGVLRRADVPTMFAPAYRPRSVTNSPSHSGQFPLNSKKSSK